MKTILITGSTDGIGKLAAIQFAKEGHEVFIHGRNAEKLTRVIAEIKESSNNSNVNGCVADFSDLKAVKQMATEIKGSLSKIDVLINNAGVFKSPVSMTEEGLDIRFAVNYFAPYLLTQELIPLLEKGNDARLINLSSAAQSPVSYEALGGDLELSSQAAYAQSKLALTMWSFQLAEQLKNIAVVPVNPGSLLNTNMVKEAYGKYWSPADKGSNILYDLAIKMTSEEINGKYFDNDRGSFGPAHTDAYDKDGLEKLNKFTLDILSKY